MARELPYKAADGDAIEGPSELVGTALESTKTHGRKPKRERGRRRAHHGENRRRIQLGLAKQRAVDRGGAPAGYAAAHCAPRGSRSGRESEIGARRRLGLKRGQKSKARGREKDRGERGPAVLNRERGEREEAVGGEGADRWTPSVGEREGEGGGGRLGLAQREKKGCRVWAEQAKSERGGGRKKDFALFNFKPIFKYIIKFYLNSNLLLLKTTQHQK